MKTLFAALLLSSVAFATQTRVQVNEKTHYVTPEHLSISVTRMDHHVRCNFEVDHVFELVGCHALFNGNKFLGHYVQSNTWLVPSHIVLEGDTTKFAVEPAQKRFDVYNALRFPTASLPAQITLLKAGDESQILGVIVTQEVTRGKPATPKQNTRVNVQPNNNL